VMNKKVIIGTCEEFCPVKEVAVRRKEKLLHKWEVNHREHDGQYEALVPVKEYSRPAAGQTTPSHATVRTPATLLACTRYLVDNVVRRGLREQSCARDILELYDFIFDRLRSIRQDMVLQELKDKVAMEILSTCVRFHLVFGHLLATQSPTTFSHHLNSSHQLDCVKSYLLLCDQDQIMSSVYLLSNMDSPAALSWAIKILNNKGEGQKDNPFSVSRQNGVVSRIGKQNIIKNHENLLEKSMKIARCFNEGNHVRFFREVKSCPVLLLIASSKYCQLMAHHAIRVFSTAYSSKNAKYPLPLLSEKLWIPEKYSILLCQHHGQPVDIRTSPDTLEWVRWNRTLFNPITHGNKRRVYYIIMLLYLMK
jgi:hypothetical protein